jgi:hypothetical protein
MPTLKASEFATAPNFHLSPEVSVFGKSKRFILAGETGNEQLVIAVPNCQVSFAIGSYGPYLKADARRNAELVKTIQDTILAQLSEKLGCDASQVKPLLKPVAVDPEDKIASLFHSQQLFLSLRRKGCKVSDASGKEPDYQELVESKKTRKCLLFINPESVVKDQNNHYQLRLEITQIYLLEEEEKPTADEQTSAFEPVEVEASNDPTQLI